MKILFLSALYPPQTKGGGELSTHYIAQGLVELGHEVTVITSGPKQEQVVLDGVTVVRLPLPLTAKPLFEERHTKKVAKQLQPIIEKLGSFDIYHAHDFRTAQILSELPYEPKLVTARDYAQICGSTNALLDDGGICTCSWVDVWHNHRVVEAAFPRNLFRVWQYRYNIDYRKSSFRKFKHQIFISAAQAELIRRYQDLSGVQTQVIYNPIGQIYLDTPLTPPKNRDLLYVGTVESYKGVGLLLESFHAIAQQFPDVQLKIVGEGADRAEYERLVASWGLQYRVTFVGRVAWDALLPLYDNAAIVIAPHIWVEPFGRTVIEAMARGRVVITANRGGPGELIHDGQTGLLFTPANIPALTAAIERALKRRPIDQREMQKAAREWVEAQLTMSQIAHQYEAVFAKIHSSVSKPAN